MVKMDDLLKDKVLVFDESLVQSQGFSLFIKNTKSKMEKWQRKYYMTRIAYEALVEQADREIELRQGALALVEELKEEGLLEVLYPKGADGIVQLTKLNQEEPLLYLTLNERVAEQFSTLSQMSSYQGAELVVGKIDGKGDVCYFF